MAAVVEIKINVDGSNAAAGVQQVKKEFDGFSMVMTQTEQDAQRLSKSMDLTGIKTREMGGHVATGLDSVRLLSQEFGLRLPRAIEAMLSRMPGVTNALSSVLGGMVAITGVEVFGHVIQGAKRLYDEFFSLNTIIEKYNDGIEKARQADLPNSRSLETTQQRLRDQTQIGALKNADAESLHDQGIKELMAGTPTFRQALLGPGVGTLNSTYNGLFDLYRAQQQGNQGIEADTARDALSRKQIDDQHQVSVAIIEQNHARDSALTGEQKINAELQKKIDIAKETRTYQNNVDKSFGNEISPNSGLAEQMLKESSAMQEAAAQKTVLGRESALAIMKADDQRVQAGLQGEALFARKMQDDIKETTRELENQGKAAEIPAKVREINEKYFADLSERTVKTQNESGLSIRRSQAQGLTGAARIYADQNISVNENNTKLASDPGAQHEANVAAAGEANQKLLDLQIQFVESMDAVGERWVDSTLSGYDRIDAEATKSSSDIKDKFSKAWGGAGVEQTSSQFIAAKQAEQDALTNVQRGAATKRQQYSDQEQQETLRYDQQAAEAERRVKGAGLMGWVTDYKASIAEIEAQEAVQTAKLNDEYKKREISWDAYQQRTSDVQQQAAAEIEQQQQAMKQKLSGMFEQAFSDPIGTIKSMMEKLMFDLLAKWVLHFHAVQALFGSVTPGGSAQSGPAGVAGQIAGAMNAGGGATAAAQPGASSSPGGGVFRPAYSSGTGPAGQVSSAGIVGGAASPGAIGGDVSSAQQLAQLTGFDATVNGGPIAQMSSDPGTSASGGQVFDDQGNATLTGDIAEQSIPAYQPPAVSGGSNITAMGVLGAAGAAYAGEQTTVSAFDQGSAKGVLSGTLGDAAAGATIGSLGGPLGTAIGAGVGAAVGFASGLTGAIMGMGGRIAARDYYEKTLFPAIEADRNGQSGDAMSAISDVHKQAVDGYGYMASHFGASGADWVKANYLDKEVALAISQITEHAQGGQQYTTRQAMQFDTGGYINDFGDFGTTGGHGFIHAELGETMINQPATAMHAPVLNAMNDGASPSDIARMYLASSRSSSSSAAAPSGGDQHIHVHAWDTDSVTKWLRTGGSRTIAKEQNNLATQYAGDGSIG